jgi:hypothetical protein
MKRKEFLQKSLKLGLGASALLGFEQRGVLASAAPNPEDQLSQVKREKEFIENWLTDLLDTMDAELDEKSRVKLIEGCGRGCFRRYQFKQDIATQGKGNLEKLIEAYKRNFEIWQEGNQVHIRYGAVSNGCYCPAARYRPVKPNDLHCECSRTTHQTIFETALGRPFKVDVVESLRRGGKTCHFVVHLT